MDVEFFELKTILFYYFELNRFFGDRLVDTFDGGVPGVLNVDDVPDSLRDFIVFLEAHVQLFVTLGGAFGVFL